MYMYRERMTNLNDGRKMPQGLKNLSNLHKKQDKECQNKIRVSHVQELKKSRKFRKYISLCDNKEDLYFVLFQSVVPNETATNQILCEVRIQMQVKVHDVV
jgi:hypothetical protein